MRSEQAAERVLRNPIDQRDGDPETRQADRHIRRAATRVSLEQLVVLIHQVDEDLTTYRDHSAPRRGS
jgi:hypothetical protein